MPSPIFQPMSANTVDGEWIPNTERTLSVMPDIPLLILLLSESIAPLMPDHIPSIIDLPAEARDDAALLKPDLIALTMLATADEAFEMADDTLDEIDSNNAEPAEVAEEQQFQI